MLSKEIFSDYYGARYDGCVLKSTGPEAIDFKERLTEEGHWKQRVRYGGDGPDGGTYALCEVKIMCLWEWRSPHDDEDPKFVPDPKDIWTKLSCTELTEPCETESGN